MTTYSDLRERNVRSLPAKHFKTAVSKLIGGTGPGDSRISKICDQANVTLPGAKISQSNALRDFRKIQKVLKRDRNIPNAIHGNYVALQQSAETLYKRTTLEVRADRAIKSKAVPSDLQPRGGRNYSALSQRYQEKIRKAAEYQKKRNEKRNVVNTVQSREEAERILRGEKKPVAVSAAEQERDKAETEKARREAAAHTSSKNEVVSASTIQERLNRSATVAEPEESSESGEGASSSEDKNDQESPRINIDLPF